MRQKFSIKGMTCNGCVETVKEALLGVTGVHTAAIDLERQEAIINFSEKVHLEDLKSALPPKYDISYKEQKVQVSSIPLTEEKSKWQQLRPLFLIFLYLFGAAILLNIRSWNTQAAMLDFMGLFYIVFSFFKILDLRGFPDTFRMYDPLAKAIPAYAWVYPFLELGLGLLFLMRFQIPFALVVTLIILGITTFGVARTLFNKKKIRCACLGTALQLPMTEATLIENAIMLIMAATMLITAGSW